MAIFIKVVCAWLLLISIYAFAKMGWDKSKAKKEQGRVPEKNFFKLAAIGGAIGIIIGMQVWRHKTQKWQFKGPVYGIFAVQVILVIILYYFLFWEARG